MQSQQGFIPKLMLKGFLSQVQSLILTAFETSAVNQQFFN